MLINWCSDRWMSLSCIDAFRFQTCVFQFLFVVTSDERLSFVNCSFHYHYGNGGENFITSLVTVIKLDVNFKQHKLDWSQRYFNCLFKSRIKMINFRLVFIQVYNGKFSGMNRRKIDIYYRMILRLSLAQYSLVFLYYLLLRTNGRGINCIVHFFFTWLLWVSGFSINALLKMYPDFWGEKIPKRNSAISGWLNTETFCVKNDPTKRYFLNS